MTFKRYSYRHYAGDGPSTSLEVELLGVNGYVETTLALVDSGSEWSGMSIDLAAKLGADLSLCKPVTSQTGGGLAPDNLWWNENSDGMDRDDVAVRVMGHEVALAPILSPAIAVVTLGREDFLTSFKFSMDQRDQTFTLEPYDEEFEAWRARTGRA